jgi:hypothetical protein
MQPAASQRVSAGRDIRSARLLRTIAAGAGHAVGMWLLARLAGLALLGILK